MITNLYRFCISATILNIAVDARHCTVSFSKVKRSLWPETGLFLNTSNRETILFGDIAASEVDTEEEICLHGDILDLSSMNISTIPPLSYFTPCAPREENIILLYLRYNSISTLPQDFFQHLKHLKGISLNTNNITTIYKGVFNDHGTLEMVDLAHNRISFISNGAFNVMPNLQILILSDNKLKQFNSFWFHKTTNLTRLIFSFNRIETLPEEAFKNILNIEDAQEINFNNNKIKSLSSKTFKGVKKIGLLALQNNQIDTWKDDFFDEGQVNVLRIHNNKIKCLESNFGKNDGFTFMENSSLGAK